MRTVVAGLIAVAVAFTVVLGLGFQLRSSFPSISDDTFGVIAGLSIGAVSWMLVCAMLRISPWKPVVELIDVIAVIAAGPGHRTRASRRPPPLHRLREPSAAQLAYAADVNKTAACVHLQPIERAMRLAGLDVRLLEISPYAPVVEAHCRVNVVELQRVFALPASIYYQEGYQPERSLRDNPRADIICGDCLRTDRAHSDILVLHPDQCREDTPWFPAPP